MRPFPPVFICAITAVVASMAQVPSEPPAAGIGIMLKDLDDIRTVRGVFDGSPADRAGIKPGDLLLQIDDRNLADVRTVREFVALIRGGAGTEVKHLTSIRMQIKN